MLVVGFLGQGGGLKGGISFLKLSWLAGTNNC